MNSNSTRIVLIDDHPIVALGVKAMLDFHTNHKLMKYATTGKELIEYLQNNEADLLLLDLNLPDYEYAILIKEVKAIAPHMKIVAYTAYNEPNLVKTVLRQKIDGYLLKSTPPYEFRSAVTRVLEEDEVYIGSNVQLCNPQVAKPKRLKDSFQKCLSLSKREREILGLISQGYTSVGISKALFISKHTVETHRKNILRKLNFNSSTELVKFAVQQGLV